VSAFNARLTDDWLPLPQPLLDRLGWVEGTLVEIELVDVPGQAPTLVVTPKAGAQLVNRPAPSKRSSLRE